MSVLDSKVLLMFSKASENFKRYTHFHEQIYIIASRLGADKTMISISMSSRFRIDQTKKDAERSQKCTPTVVHVYP